MKIMHACGYYSELAVKAGKPRPRNPPFYEAYLFCLAVKTGVHRFNFYIERKAGKLHITKDNFNLVRPTFGGFVARALPSLSTEPFLIVPVPSKDALPEATTYRSLKMAQDALKGSTYEGCVVDALRWKEPVKPAHEGGPRKREELLPFLEAYGDLKDTKIVLIDDLVTTGGALLACQDCLLAAGGVVLGAITCGRTVYDAKVHPFKVCEFELTEQLQDYQAGGAAARQDS